MPEATLLIAILRADARAVPLRAEAVDCVVTSPPYWSLRDYGVDGQIGLEATPQEYVDTMVGVFREVWRVLKPTGSLWLNIGDCYAFGKNGRNARSVWTMSSEPYPDAHYATFPRELARRCILAGCPRGGIVFDPFGGSGTVGRVAIENGRLAVLGDLAYHDHQRKRTSGVQVTLPIMG